MTLAYILDVTAEYLRQKNNWQKAQCRVSSGGEPKGESLSAPFYIGIDEGNVSYGPYRNQLQLQETSAIEVHIWRKSGEFPADRQGYLIDNQNPYLLSMLMPKDLEKLITKQLHGNLEIVTKANELAATNTDNSGSGFSLPLKLMGRGKHRTEAIDTNPGGGANTAAVIPYVVRTLTFGGMYRLQHSDNIA